MPPLQEKSAPVEKPESSLASHASLALLWWGTVAASLHDGGDSGVALLQQATGLSPHAALAVVLPGSAWDAAVGLLLTARAVVARLVVRADL